MQREDWAVIMSKKPEEQFYICTLRMRPGRAQRFMWFLAGFFSNTDKEYSAATILRAAHLAIAEADKAERLYREGGRMKEVSQQELCDLIASKSEKKNALKTVHLLQAWFPYGLIVTHTKKVKRKEL